MFRSTVGLYERGDFGLPEMLSRALCPVSLVSPFTSDCCIRAKAFLEFGVRYCHGPLQTQGFVQDELLAGPPEDSGAQPAITDGERACKVVAGAQAVPCMARTILCCTQRQRQVREGRQAERR